MTLHCWNPRLRRR